MRHGPRAATFVACLTALLTVPAVGASAAVAAGGSCPGNVNGRSFASVAQLRSLVKQENRFGERYLASRAHNRTIGWIKDEVGAIPGFRVRSDPYRLWRWLPRTKAKGRPGLDLARAGGLTVTGGGATTRVPGRRRGPLVQADGQARPDGPARRSRPGRGDHRRRTQPARSWSASSPPPRSRMRPCRASASTSHPISPARPETTSARSSTRSMRTCSPRARPVPQGSSSRSTCRASRCGDTAILTTGTIYRLPGVFVGGAEARRLRSLAAQGGSARVVVRATVERAKTTNVIATLPGRSSQRMVLADQHGRSVVGPGERRGRADRVRPLLRRPAEAVSPADAARSRSRAPTTRSSATGWTVYSAPLDAQYEKGEWPSPSPIEHLGTREIVPNAAGNRLRSSPARGEPFLFGAGQQRAPAPDGGRTRPRGGTSTRPRCCRAWGCRRPGRYRRSARWAGSAASSSRADPDARDDLRPVVALRRRRSGAARSTTGGCARSCSRSATPSSRSTELPRAQIAGDYPEMREQRAQGTPTCRNPSTTAAVRAGARQ